MMYFTPPISGTFEFEIFCEVEAVDADGNPVKPPGMNPEDPALDEEDVKADPLHCKVVGKASFPTLQVVDARLNPTNTVVDLCTHKLWEQFNLSSLNQVLSTPLTKEEVKLNAESSPDMSRIPVYDVNFSPSVLGSMREEIFLKVSNLGMLPVKYSIKFPNEKEVELEQWADEGEPTSEELRQSSIIDQHLFDIQPRSGSLEPDGGSLVITMHYSYDTMEYDGFHDLPILFRVDKGKMFVLRLCGRTLKPAQPHLLLPSLEQNMKPVAIGETGVPEQEIQLYNPGTSDLEYTVKLGEVDALMETNFDHPIFTCLNPEGCVPARGSTALRWLFSPLEAKQYDVKVKVSFLGVDGEEFGGEESLQLSAEGFHPEYSNPFQKPEAAGLPPSRQLLELPGLQLAMFSMDVVDFGPIPDGSSNHRMVMLQNKSSETVEYGWDRTNALLTSGPLNVIPESGKIKAGEHVLCKLVLKPEPQPFGKCQYIDHDLVCFVNTVRCDGAAAATNGKSHKNKLVRRGSVRSTASSSKSIRGGPSSSAAALRSSASRGSGFGDVDLRHSLGGSPKNNAPLSSAASVKSFASGLDRPSSETAGGLLLPTSSQSSRAGHVAGLRSTVSRGETRRSSRISVEPEPYEEPPPKQMLHLRVRGCVLSEDSIRRLRGMPAPELEKFFRLPPRVERGLPPSIVAKRWARDGDDGAGNQTNDLNENRNDGESENDTLWYLSAPGNAGLVTASATKDAFSFLFKNLIEDVTSSYETTEKIETRPQEGPTPYFKQFRSNSAEEPTTSRVATAAFGESFEESKQAIVNDAECQALLHAVLENTMFNMISEFSYGDINLAAPQTKFYFSGTS
jgi:hypothetical protein